EAKIAGLLTNTDKYTFFIPPDAHWSKIRHVKTNVGSALNKALEALEDANVDSLQDVLKHINFNRKIGQRTLDDDTLADFVQNFEFPDLLGAPYEYLIKFFADSAGKKACEFYASFKHWACRSVRSKAKVAMAYLSWPVSGFIRFASLRITARASSWLVSKIIWIALDGA